MPIADIPGGSLHYDVAGAGLASDRVPLVLLLPQSAGPVGITSLIDGLAKYHAVITYDQRGTGGSSPAPETMSMATQAADLVGLLGALNVGKANLLCHSTGCGIGISVAAAHAERLDKLVLTSPWTYADPHLTTMQNLRVAAARALDPVQYAHFNAALLFPPEYRRAHQAGFERLAIEASDRPQDADTIKRRLDAILAFDARPHLAAFRIRTLIIAAQDDQLMPAWFAAEAARSIHGSELLELDGGGHMLLETRTSEIVDAVLRFLQRTVAS